jgi:hypothetical protein
MRKKLNIALILLLAMVLTGITPDTGLALAPNVTIGPMNYTSAPLVVGEQETLTFSLSDSGGGTHRDYRVEWYGVRGSAAYLKSAKTVTLASGQSSTAVSFLGPFTSTGSLYTLVKVYSSSDGTLLAQRQSAYTNTVYGYWTISIQLPKSRLAKGSLTLFNAEGTATIKAECLGLSQYRDTTTMYQTNGNTPTGIYTGRLDGPYTPTRSYGPYQVINMAAVSGAAKTSGRSGIWIHGGDPGVSSVAAIYPLRMTNGCVRISNADQLRLQNMITDLVANCHYSTGTIYINDY